ncbi:MAG: UDP-N-acetylmuramoyl-tripeptide--D-alanyl-D-alanine ligase [Balneolales bacterium]
MARNTLYRGRFFLHMYQLSGYKVSEFGGWLTRNLSAYSITAELLAFNFVVLVLAGFLDPYLTRTSPFIIIFIFGLFWLGPVSRYTRARVKKPLVFTPRMIRLTTLYGLLGMVIPVYCTWLSFYQGILFPEIYILAFGWILGSILLPFILLLAGWLMQPVESLVQERFKIQARKKLASMPDLKIIAITGSYGKTSTKYFIKTLLAERFNICFTPGSYNTPMGICKVINNDLQPAHQILILEMGARYKGNIDELCSIAGPDVAVLTNIGIAHLETFGSVDAIRATKGEILDHLSGDGVAVINADDPVLEDMVTQRKVRTIRTGLETGQFQASGISYDESGCKFIVTGPDHATEKVYTRLLGSHNIQNLLLAFGVGHHFGLRLKTMALAARKIGPVEHRMELKKNDSITIIDDAFNSNPVGARNAVETLAKFKTGRRILITPGMVELGEKEKEENERFGEAIGRAGLDRVYLVGPEQTRPIWEGIRRSGFNLDQVTVVPTLFEANKQLREDFQAGDIVLYENDLPDTYNEA